MDKKHGSGKFISVDDLKNVFDKAQKGIDAKYNNGVESTKRNRITAEAASIVDDLYKRDEEELHSHKDDLFRKVRKVFINGIVFITPFFIGLPIKMVDEAIQRKVDLNNAKSYNKIYDREILWANQAIRDEQHKGHDTSKLVSYRNNLKKGKIKLNNYIQELEKKEDEYEKKHVRESFILQQSSLLQLSNVTENFFTLNSRIALNMKPANFELRKDAFLKTRDLIHKGGEKNKFTKYLRAFPPPHVEFELTRFCYDEDHTCQIYAIVLTGNRDIKEQARKNIMKFLHDVNNELKKNNRFKNFEIKLGTDSDDYAEFVLYDHTKTVKESFILKESCETPYGVFLMFPEYDANSDKSEDKYNDEIFESFLACLETARDTVRSVVHAGKDVANTIHKKAVNIDKAAEPLDNIVNDTIKNVRDSIRADKRDEIILGENRVKLLRVIGKSLAYGGLVLVHPALAAIAFLGKMAYDTHIDGKERQRIVNDLEHELVMVKEKIKDAESKGDNENKYKLMRIENKLEREIARIKYRIDEKV